MATKFFLFLILIIVATCKGDKKESIGTVIGIDLGTTYSWYSIFYFNLTVPINRSKFFM